MIGKSDVWFGLGFGAHAMLDAPWTIVVDGTGTVSEYKLASHAPGTVLNTTVNVISNTVDAKTGKRTVVLTRSLQGKDNSYYTFATTSNDATIPIIVAVGNGPKFGYHKERTPTSITLLPLDSAGESAGESAGACVCPQKPKPYGEATGSLVYHGTNQTADTGEGAVGFSAHKCANWPYTD